MIEKSKRSRSAFEPFEWQTLGPVPVIGVDEAGRGCLAGPVFAGAVILLGDAYVDELTDSKLLSEKRRDELFDLILAHHRVGIGFATVAEIESLNILNAALLAMKRAVLDLEVQSGHVLVDGNQKIKHLEGFVQTPLVKGDLRASPISAASIVAKVSRDRVMYELAKEFPQFGFEQHKGYATEMHRHSIREFGPTQHHRKTFAGVREFLI